MNYDWKKIDLKNASIFDFTDDLEIIRVCIGDEKFTMDSKKEYLKKINDKERYASLSTFSEIVGDSDLEYAIDDVFPIEALEYYTSIIDDI